MVVLAVRNAGRRDLLRSPSADTWVWAAVVAVMLIENITESFILRFSYNWVIVMAAALRGRAERPAVHDDAAKRLSEARARAARERSEQERAAARNNGPSGP